MNALMSSTAKASSSLMYLFGSFKPSERKILLDSAIHEKMRFISALDDFLDRWARADWLEEYNVERVGRWMAENCAPELVSSAKNAAKSKLAANAPISGSVSSVYTSTYRAFISGVEKQFECK